MNQFSGGMVIAAETWCEFGGTAMKVLQAGRGDAVLLGHSYLWDAGMWRAQIEALSQYYHVIAPCLWGHGGSGPLPAGTISLRDIAMHHLALLDSLDVERVSMVGHSLGGMWGAQLALIAPERVRSLVLIDSCLEAEPEVTRHRYFAMLTALEAARSVPPAIAQEVAAMFFSPALQARDPEVVSALRDRLAEWLPVRLTDSVVPIGRMTFGRRGVLGEVVRLPMPKLVIHGVDDIPRPLEEGRRMAQALGCDLIALSGAGHMAPVESADAVTAALLHFLTAVHRLEPMFR